MTEIANLRFESGSKGSSYQVEFDPTTGTIWGFFNPSGTAMVLVGTKSQGQGHETTYAQIVAEELGIPMSQVQVEEGDTDTAPYGLGTYASRSTPTAGAAAAMAARKIRDKARKIAAYLLEADEEDLEWEPGKFSVRGNPDAVMNELQDSLKKFSAAY